MNLLFVCSRNQWRSPTGEAIWRKVSGVSARSAGTSRNARRRLCVADLRWADIIFFMEEKHASRVKAEFRDETRDKPHYVLDIPDEYKYMDPELVETLREATEPLVEKHAS